MKQIKAARRLSFIMIAAIQFMSISFGQNANAAEPGKFRIDPEKEPAPRFRIDPERSALHTQEQQLLRALDELKSSDLIVVRKIESLEKELKALRDAMDKIQFELKRIRIDMMS